MVGIDKFKVGEIYNCQYPEDSPGQGTNFIFKVLEIHDIDGDFPDRRIELNTHIISDNYSDETLRFEVGQQVTLVFLESRDLPMITHL